MLQLHFHIPEKRLSVSSAEVNWSLEYRTVSVLLEVRNVSTKTVVNSIQLLPFASNLLQSQRLRFKEETLTGAPLKQEQQQRPNGVHENLKVSRIQDPVQGWHGQEVVVDNFSTSDSGVAKVSPMSTSGIDTTPTSPNIFDIAVKSYGFDYPVFDEVNGDGIDVDLSNNDDDTHLENDDEENEENIPLVAQTPYREIEREREREREKRENDPHPVHLTRCQGVPLQSLEKFPESVISFFSKKFFEFI